MLFFCFILLTSTNVWVFGHKNDGELPRNVYKSHSLYFATVTSMKDVEFVKSLTAKETIKVELFEQLPYNPNFNFTNANKIPMMVNFKTKRRDDLELLAIDNDVSLKEVVEFVSDILQDHLKDKDAFKNKPLWESYRSLLDVYRWLGQMTNKYPHITRMESIGLSAEERDILMFTISNKSNTFCYKVCLEAGAHGNEWLSTAFVTYFIDQLLTSTKGPLYNLRNKYCWFFIPVLNPDGYVYSQAHDCLWKKNRHRSMINLDHIGSDLNRNFPYNFKHVEYKSTDQSWPGDSALSEPESKALADFLAKNHEFLTHYFSIHGFGQKFLIPYSDTEVHESNYKETANMAKAAARRIFRETGRKYHVGTPWQALGIKWVGSSADWVKKVYNVPYVLTLLLRDDGIYGNLLPKEQIVPACHEMTEGLIEFMTADPQKLVANVFDFNNNAASLKISVVPTFILICFIFANIF